MLHRKSKLAATASIVAAMFAVPGVAHADAVAQSILNVTEFTFRQGNGDATLSTTQLVLTSPDIANTGDVFASLVGTGSGAASAGPTPGGFNISRCFGACGSYSAGTELVGAPTATFAGSTSTLSGSALDPTNPPTGANALTDNTVSLAPQGDGTAQGNVNLNAEFTFSTGAAQSIEINFFAEGYLRAFLDGPGVATAALDWSIGIERDNGDGTFTEVFSWTPNGVLGVVDGGTEYLDPFDLDREISTLSASDVVVNPAKARFHVETDVIAAGDYKLTINHIARADATIEQQRVPEPATLSLLGLGLLAAAGAAKRRRAA